MRDEVVLFSSAPDGAAPTGAISFPLYPSRLYALRCFNLASGARYDFDLVDGVAVPAPGPDG